MDHRAMIEEHLALAWRHVSEGERQVAEQRERVFVLAKGGHDTTEASRLLQQFEELQALHVVDRDRLKLEFAELGAAGTVPSHPPVS